MPSLGVIDQGTDTGGIVVRTPNGGLVQRRSIISAFDRMPKVNADVDPSAFSTQTIIRAYTAASRDWLLLGTNAASANVAQLYTGGITLQTAGANNDQMILWPLLINSVYQSELGWIYWTPERESSFQFTMSAGSDVSSIRIVAGFKLSNAFDFSTDADHHLFVFDTGVATTWQCYNRVATTNNNVASSAAIFKTSPSAGTKYTLGIAFNRYSQPVFTIDGVTAAVGPAATTGALFRPFIGVQALTGSARQMNCLSLSLGLNS